MYRTSDAEVVSACVAAQLEMQVFTLSGGFDEGADHVQWQSWAAEPRQ